MAVFKTYDQIGRREDLADVIYNVGIKDTILLGKVGKTKVDSTFHEWQTDSYAAASTSNALVEGAVSAANQSATTRVGNYTQISDKTFQVSDTAVAMDVAGRSDDINYFKVKKGAELLRDMEATLFANQASDAGAGDTARKVGGLPSWIETNASRGGSGINGGYSSGTTSAATDGTQRDLTEDIFKGVLVTMAGNTGNMDGLMVTAGAFNKQKISTFTGSNTRFNDIEAGTIHASVDVYVSDFGTLNIMFSPFQRARDIFVINPNFVKVGFVGDREFKTTELAKTDDSRKFNIISEYTLEVQNEAAHAVIADVSTS